MFVREAKQCSEADGLRVRNRSFTSDGHSQSESLSTPGCQPLSADLPSSVSGISSQFNCTGMFAFQKSIISKLIESTAGSACFSW